ncbi:uncharacterized protein LOC131876317 isoform X2 [Cryptomeria japonica]|uniref:uncharacterized protein LOC131876317 isoform X2 n=1 Tax=Cryptomeria japonica TaxID=3369 RepID=UPI0027DA6CF0|nr:uncharacterized protein LOC131876317 isoform X2 [Cryptomeria japonica]
MSSSMDESAHSFPEMSSSIDESAHLSPEIRSSMDGSASPFPEMRSSMDESAHLFPGMDRRLYAAAELGNVSMLEKVIKAKVNIFQEFTALHNSALHIAVSRGNLRFIERLLKEISNDLDAAREFVRVRNSDGNSALHLAAFYGHHELVERLIGLMEGDVEAGNFLRSVNCEGNTALHEAAKGGNDKVVKVLLKHARNQDDLTGVSNQEVFLEHGRHHDAAPNSEAPLTNVSNLEGETALFIASQSGHADIVEILLDSTTHNSSMKRNDGQTPLHSAVFYIHTGKHERYGDVIKITRLLLAKDNSLCYKQDNKKKTPLHMAVEWEKYSLVQILLRHGRDCMELVDSEGRKPLHLAVLNAVRSILFSFKNMLLSLMSKESLNHRDNTRRTALHIAMENIEKDPLLYKNIIILLRLHGALFTSEILEDKRRIELSASKKKTSIKAENISINAVLIATVSFAAAFTLPGGLVSPPGENPKAILMDTFLFKLFPICDTSSFCTSIASALLVLYADKGDQQDHPQVMYSFNFLWAALLLLVGAFGKAVHMVIAPSPWLAGIVWTMVCLLPLTIHVVRFRSKHFIFFADSYKIWPILSFPFAIILGIICIMSDVLNVILFSGLFYNLAHWTKKLFKRRR